MTVHLLGVGPGGADLLTLEALRLLGSAHAVVHDRLVGRDVLDHVCASAERYDVGKTPGAAGPTQSEINELLVQLGRRHERVVRIKGGDPSVFGRGAEEADACHAAGLETRTVPGISSCVAAPIAAGVSVTRRGVASGFCVVTAHQDPGSTPLDWDAIARSGLTVVVLMGAARARSVAERLMAGGMARRTPVAIVTGAYLDSHISTRTELGKLGDDPVAAPSVIVIGEVADSSLSTLASDHLRRDPSDPVLATG